MAHLIGVTTDMELGSSVQLMPDRGILNMPSRSFPDKHFPVKVSCVVAAFSDTGHGISKENLQKIFDRFFTTKETGKERP